MDRGRQSHTRLMRKMIIETTNRMHDDIITRHVNVVGPKASARVLTYSPAINEAFVRSTMHKLQRTMYAISWSSPGTRTWKTDPGLPLRSSEEDGCMHNNNPPLQQF